MTPGDYINIKPSLATEWSRTPDGKGWRFRIRDGVKFSSGNTMTAEDVKWSLDRVRSEEHTSELQSHSDLVCRLLLEKKNTREQRHGCEQNNRALPQREFEDAGNHGFSV